MNCKYCNSYNPPDNKFCTDCGRPLAVVNNKICSNGHVYVDSLEECPYCPSPQLQSKMSGATESGGIASFRRDNDATRIIDSGTAASVSSKKTVILSSENLSAGSGLGGASRKLVGWLVTFSWSDKGEDYRLYEGRNLLGGDKSSDIVLSDPAVSSSHCIILFRGDKAKIKDELSSNGTYVNGHEVEESELNDGDMIRVGKTELKFRSI